MKERVILISFSLISDLIIYHLNLNLVFYYIKSTIHYYLQSISYIFILNDPYLNFLLKFIYFLCNNTFILHYFFLKMRYFLHIRINDHFFFFINKYLLLGFILQIQLLRCFILFSISFLFFISFSLIFDLIIVNSKVSLICYLFQSIIIPYIISY